MKQLRPYQQNIVDQVVSSKKDLIVCLPCGAGKTVIASAIMNELPGLKVFIVPRLELIKQANEEFKEAAGASYEEETDNNPVVDSDIISNPIEEGESKAESKDNNGKAVDHSNGNFDVDIIWSAKTRLTGKSIILSSKDSLRTQYKKIPDIHPLTLFFDECHVSIKQTKALVDALHPDRVLGFTATPERMDGLALLKGTDPVGAPKIHKYGVFDEVLKAETTASLIDKNFLTPLHYYTRPIPGITKIKAKKAAGDELTGAQMIHLFDTNAVWGDLVKCYEEYGKGRPAIGFTPSIHMAEQVVQVFQNAGYDFRVICGQMSVKERQALIHGLEARQLDGLVNADLLTYGFDCPVVSYAFSCRHIKSRPLWFQIVGRVLRTAEGKTDAVFVDHGDSISEFASVEHPLPILDPFLEWSADGKDDAKKEEDRRKAKRAQDMIKQIRDLDPRPADMVEVTTESLDECFMKAYKRAMKNIDALTKELKAQSTRADEACARADALEQELAHTNVALEQAKKAQPVRTVNSEKTFEFLRKHYCKVRHTLEDRMLEQTGTIDDEAVHKETVQAFLDEESKLDFYYDRVQFQKSMYYWKNHYTRDWNWTLRGNR